VSILDNSVQTANLLLIINIKYFHLITKFLFDFVIFRSSRRHPTMIFCFRVHPPAFSGSVLDCRPTAVQFLSSQKDIFHYSFIIGFRIHPDENIFRLEIAMDQFHFVNVVESIGQLVENLGRGRHWAAVFPGISFIQK
jgi:hypothetical protein